MTAKAVRIKIKLGGHPSAAPGVSYTPPLIPWRRAAETRKRTIIVVGISLVIATVAVWLVLPTKSEDPSVPSWVGDARESSPPPEEIAAQDFSAFAPITHPQSVNLESSPASIASPPQPLKVAPTTMANNALQNSSSSVATAEQISRSAESGNQNGATSALASQKPPSGVASTTKPTTAETVAEKISSTNIVRAQLATKLQGLEPANSVGNQVKAKTRGTVRVYYFNEVHGLKGKTVSHQWTHDGKIYANVSAEIKSNTWRMYSSKALNSTMLGEWKIQVTDDKGNVLATRAFSYN